MSCSRSLVVVLVKALSQHLKRSKSYRDKLRSCRRSDAWSPIAMVVKNLDFRLADYKGDTMKKYLRPSHADFTYLEKYGIKSASVAGARVPVRLWDVCLRGLSASTASNLLTESK